MPIPVVVAIVALWAGFFVSWLAAARWSSTPEKRIGDRAELPYSIVLMIGGIALLAPARNGFWPLRLWYATRMDAWICVGLIAAGFAFSWWARIHLGQLWSGQITMKADHRVIDTGPYRIVRHPIYTGILLAVFATAAAKGTALALVAAVLITLGVWMKARLEEGWLRRELGPDTYDAYRRLVPMLIPLGPKPR
jgi:protein-S-isoprenylcysteine O-methyltransferase Ste14